MNVYNILQFYLPAGGELISPKGPRGARGVRLVDLDGDGIQEIIALYKWREEVHILILKDDEKHWTKLAQIKGRGHDVDFFKLVDIKGNGNLSIVIGWETGQKDKELDVYAFQDNEVEILTEKVSYHKIEVVNLSENKVGVVLWKHVIGEAYEIETLGWECSELTVVANKNHKYFRRVVTYYTERLKELPKAAFYWYYLADAQIMADMRDEALASIKVGTSLGSDYPSSEDFEALGKKILSYK